MVTTTTYLTGNRDLEESLVVVFLRGGADGLNLVPPLGDDDYFSARPGISIGRKDAIRLDDFFGLNPLLGGLEAPFKSGELSVFHCAGSEDATRSHFEAQDLMEHGGTVAGGWLGRFMRASKLGNGGPLAAVAISKSLPECLRGAPAAAAIQQVADFSLGTNTGTFQAELAKLYGAQTGILGSAGADTLAALNKINAMVDEDYSPRNGAIYADDHFSFGLRQIAHLIRGKVGMRAASIDLGGWDSHLTQAAVMNPEMTKLSAGLAAFHQDMGRDLEKVTLVVMTEFGRRVAENSALGTDHGRGSVMFVLGGGFNGGRVVCDWPGLANGVLEGPGDLPVLTNYRNVLAPVLAGVDPEIELAKVFPEFALAPLDMA